MLGVHSGTLAWPMAMSLKDVPSGYSPDGRRAPGLPSRGVQGPAALRSRHPRCGARSTVVRADCQRIHSPAVVSVAYLVVFPTLAIAVGFVTYRLAGRNLFRACLAGVCCALVLEVFAALIVGLAGAV